MEDIKIIIIQKINEIININNDAWTKLDRKLKLKYIHRLCNYLETENSTKNESITIPLKSIKPTKLIQFSGISNEYNKELYLQFKKSILDYTFNFRDKYIKIPKRQYYTFTGLPKDESNKILNEYNQIVYAFMTKNKININYLLKSLICNNYDKLIINETNQDNFELNIDNNIMILTTTNLTITLTLIFANNKITNNIHVIYSIKLINNI